MRLSRLQDWLGPVLALLLLGGFTKIAGEVQERETSALDRAVSFGLHRLDSPFMDAAMRALTWLGSFPPVAAVAIGFSLWRLRRKDRRGAAMIALVAIVTEALNLVLKQSFQRARPSLFDEVAALHSYSFPSGHAMASAAIFGAAAALVGRAAPQRRRAAGIIAALLVIGIGISRIFLGVHWVTDVLAGYAAGGLVFLTGLFLLQRADRRAAAS